MLNTTYVDFYLLDYQETALRNVFVCNLLEKFFSINKHVIVYCENEQEAKIIDKLLWTFKSKSFIPHSLYSHNLSYSFPITITYKNSYNKYQDVILLNLSNIVPLNYSEFEHIVEVIRNEKNSKILGRDHYKKYLSRKYHLFTYFISDINNFNINKHFSLVKNNNV